MTGERVLQLERFAAQGRAVAHAGDKAVLVERGIAGERVAVEIVADHPRYTLARVAAVLSPSPDRVAPPCPHFERCGGCDWQHLRYDVQVAMKRQVAQEQLERIGGIRAPADWAIVPAESSLEYRDKLELVPVRTAEGWRCGMHGRNGAPVPITRCLLAPGALSRLAAAALTVLSGRGAGGCTADDDAPMGITRLTTQAGLTAGGAPALALTLQVRTAREAAALADGSAALLVRLREEIPELARISIVQGGDEERPGKARTVSGERALYKEADGLRFPMLPGTFFQVHPGQTEQLARYVTGQVAAHLPSTGAPRVFDLFCGVGLFSLPLLRAGYAVTGADALPAAVKGAEQAARWAGLPTGSFRVLDLDRPQALRALVRTAGHPHAVVADPPRKGLSARLAEDLAAAAPALLVYVSCDPATFARDARRLARRFTLAELRGFDLFPQTRHLELVGTFVWNGGS